VAIDGGDVAADVHSSPSASWMDVDGDGDEDLHVLNGYGSLEAEPVPQPDRLYRNDGGGTFTALAEHPLVRVVTFSGSGVWGDLDNDGDPDLFVANQSGADNSLFRNDGGTFTRVTEGRVVSDGGRSFSADWVDIDADGWLDLHVLNGRDGGAGEIDFVYRNDGTGGLVRVDDIAFARDTLPSGGAAWSDYDGDGDLDVFLPVQSTAGTSRLYRNDGDWRFTDVTDAAGLTTDPLPYSPASSAAQWVDYDADGDLDLFVGTTGTVDLLYRNDGAGGFRRTSAGRVGLDATYVSDALWEDLDNDADLDLVIAVWGGASEIYRNDGEGRLHPVDRGDFGAELHFASSVSSSDIDGDGDRDLFLTQWPVNERGGAPNLIFRNDSPGGHWIDVELRGTTSNRSGLGASIVVVATVGGEERSQLRLVTGRTSWRSSDGPARHFGLGDARTVHRIEVTWPSGVVDTLPGPIAADRRLLITERRP
jgi:hypothetical protein